MRNKTFFRYLVSYALVLMLPFLSIYIIFDRAMVRRFSEEQTERDTRLLAEIQEALDGEMQQLFNLAYVIQNTPSLNPKNIGEDVIARRSAITLLSTYHSILRLPEIVLVYRSGIDICYTSTTAITPRKLLEQQLVYETRTTDDFLSAVNEKDSLVVWPREAVHQFGGQTQEMLTLFLSVGAGSVAPRQRTVFVIPVRRLEDRILALTGEDASVMVLDRDGRLLLSAGQAGAGPLPPSAEGTVRLEGRNYLLMKVSSGITGWTYTVLRPSELSGGPLQSYRRWTALLLGLMLILGGLLIYLMSWGSYRPIRRLAEKARTYAPQQPSGGDMEQVEAVLDALSDESSASRTLLESSMDGLRQNCMARLLVAPSGQADALLSELRGYGSLPDPSAPCRIVALEKKELRLPAVSLPEMLVSLSLEVTDALVCENPPDRDLLALVFQYSGSGEGSDEEIRLLGARLEEENGAPVSLGVSRSVSPDALSEAYAQAASACRMRLIRGAGSVVFYSPQEQISLSFRDYPLQQLDALQWYLLQADVPGARRCLRGIAEKLQQEPVSVDAARMVCYDAINVTVRTLMSLQDRIDPKISPDTLESLTAFDSVQELTSRLENFIESACASVRNSVPDEGADPRIETMKRYIREHCFQDDFSLQMAADHFGLTPSNLSHFFKNGTGIGLSEYVQDLRRREACRLLAETEEPIQEIGRRVGMPNGSSFIRSFRQQTGLTPGQYRAGQKAKNRNPATAHAEPGRS